LPPYLQPKDYVMNTREIYATLDNWEKFSQREGDEHAATA